MARPYRARVVDEQGRAVRAGVVGELVLKGPGVTAAATARATTNGWLRTGDLAWENRVGLTSPQRAPMMKVAGTGAGVARGSRAPQSPAGRRE